MVKNKRRWEANPFVCVCACKHIHKHTFTYMYVYTCVYIFAFILWVRGSLLFLLVELINCYHLITLISINDTLVIYQTPQLYQNIVISQMNYWPKITMKMVLLRHMRNKSFKHILINEGCFCVFCKHQFMYSKAINALTITCFLILVLFLGASKQSVASQK